MMGNVDPDRSVLSLEVVGQEPVRHEVEEADFHGDSGSYHSLERRAHGVAPIGPSAHRSGAAFRLNAAAIRRSLRQSSGPITAGARGTGLRGRLTAADRMNLTWLMPAKGGFVCQSRGQHLGRSTCRVLVPISGSRCERLDRKSVV